MTFSNQRTDDGSFELLQEIRSEVFGTRYHMAGQS